jgi:hypothetical protein
MGQIYKQTFGRDLDIDPTTYFGQAVCKSDNNAAHDGRIIDCPIREDQKESNVAYNVLIDNTDGAYAFDFRLIYIKGLIDVFYQKRRPLASRFSNKNTDVILRRVRDEFSAAEIAAVEKFCVNLGADYGELDVLRDVKTGLIYIVDFAKTPAGPPNGLPRAMAVKVIEEMGIAFFKNVLARLCVSGT